MTDRADPGRRFEKCENNGFRKLSGSVCVCVFFTGKFLSLVDADNGRSLSRSSCRFSDVFFKVSFLYGRTFSTSFYCLYEENDDANIACVTHHRRCSEMIQ